MKALVFRIRRRYFDAIVAGEKTVEYRKFSPYWRTRLTTPGPKQAVFICGKKVHRRAIVDVQHIPTPSGFSEQGRRDVPTASCYAIQLGAEIQEAAR